MQTPFSKRAKSVIVGHAVGDALGVPVEFSKRTELDRFPVTDMRGYGTYHMPKGSWSDDTSMTLCALDALGGNQIDFDLIMVNFGKWYYKGEFTPTGETFDVGNTCALAVENYFVGKKSWRECGLTDEYSNGNGSLMRIHPFVLFAYRLDSDIKSKIGMIELASALTHAHERSRVGCGIYAFILWELLENPCRESILSGLKKAESYYRNNAEISNYKRLLHFVNPDKLTRTDRQDIESSGYIVHSLEAAVWCLLTSNSYKDCVLKAVNLGEDADTVGAIAGGLAGALYGYESIPREWRETLLKREYIEELCDAAFAERKKVD